LRRWVEHRLPRPPAGGARSMIARADLVRLLVVLAGDTSPQPAPVIATDGEVYSTRRMHAALCRAVQRSPVLPSPPRAAWQFAASLRDRLQGLPAGSTWDRLVGDECYQSQGLVALGFSPQLTLEHSLEQRV
jgi:UDP-glucose 4-epimerase